MTDQVAGLERAFVWSAGAAFAASLAFTAWTFLITFGRNGRTTFDRRAAVIDLVLFSLFALHHSLLARSSAKALLRRRVPERLIRTIYVWVASSLLFVACWLWQPVGESLYHVAWPLAAAGWGLQLVGLWLTVQGARAIDPLELAGIRAATVSPPLQVSGVYGIVRHPLYLGWLLMVFGAPVMTGDRLTFAIVSSSYLVIAIPLEERLLLATVGDGYRSYRQQVRWRLIPFIY